MSSVRSSIEEEESTPSNENDKGNKVKAYSKIEKYKEFTQECAKK